jgi:hypothetical protein
MMTMVGGLSRDRLVVGRSGGGGGGNGDWPLLTATVAMVDVGLDNDLRFGIGTGWTGYAGKHGPFHQMHNSI